MGAAAQAQVIHAAQSLGQGTGDRDILVVDDDAGIREALAGLLAEEGYRVSCAEHGVAALEYLRAAPALPSLIVLDFMMPLMDGRQFRIAQLQDLALRRIPVVILSACGRAETAGVTADAFMPKIDAFLLLVERLSASPTDGRVVG
jgi:CheY-like chemotaxis protein